LIAISGWIDILGFTFFYTEVRLIPNILLLMRMIAL